MIINLFLIVLCIAIGCGIWQQMRQNELAKCHIENRCEQVNVQIVSIARNGFKLIKPEGRWKVVTKYDFEFSVNGTDCYQGFAIMKGMHLQTIHMPAYPL